MRAHHELFNAREILVERWRNRRGTQIPFNAGQVFGLTVNEHLPARCTDPSLWPEISTEQTR